jgi:hypothetical protein
MPRLTTTTAAGLKLGDIVRPASLDGPDATDEGYHDATVIGIDDRDVTLFRPYTHVENTFAYFSTEPGQGTVIGYVGIETYRIPRNGTTPYRVLRRVNPPIL